MNPSARQAIAALETLYCPVNESINPEFDEIEKACTAWVDEFRLYWDEGQRARLLSTGAGEIYARALPFAPAEKVADVAKWLYWGFATDDMVYDAGPASIDSAAFLTVAAQLVRIIEVQR